MLAISMLVAAMATSPKPGELKSFDDWTVGCDNGLRCTAVSLMEMESGENQLTVQIRRDPQAMAPTRLEIANVEDRGKAGSARLVRDGGQLVANVSLPANGDPIELSLDPFMIAALGNGKKLELRDTKGQSLGTASLRGIRAALSYADAQQGRTDTITAMITKGPKPASAVPAPPALPNIMAPRLSKSANEILSREDVVRLQGRTGCDASGDPPLPQEAVRIDRRHWLAMIPCGSGAYNLMGAPVLVSGSGKSRKMKMADFDYLPRTTSENGLPVIANASWDDVRGELMSYAKGRGLGDCGSAETWVWDGRRFRLQAQMVMEDCRGVVDWIPTWRAKVTRR